jgi:cyclic pyranopterin phosphate synthase
VTLSHVDQDGRAHMVDVGGKPVTARYAVAAGAITMAPTTFALVRDGTGPKGDVLSTAELAGVMAAKRTAELIPLCHPLPLDQVEVRAELDATLPGVRVEAVVRTTARTGVEMEALTAVTVTLLTVYDMVKAAGHDLRIGEIVLLEKAGGHGGNWRRKPHDD